jgi:glycerol-3-phosphate dehydrogenase
LSCPAGDRDYLLKIAERHLALSHPEAHVTELFCGIRTIPVGRWGGRLSGAEEQHRLGAAGHRDVEEPFAPPFYLRRWSRKMSALSREAVLDWSVPGLVSIYGGKFTTYRSLSERVGDHIVRQLGKDRPSGTRHRQNWFLEDLAAEADLLVSRSSLRRP